jgi:hypothetical protein
MYIPEPVDIPTVGIIDQFEFVKYATTSFSEQQLTATAP